MKSTRYCLLYGVLSAKKPEFYCDLHKVGVSRKCHKRKCYKCNHLKPMTRYYAEMIKK